LPLRTSILFVAAKSEFLQIRVTTAEKAALRGLARQAALDVSASTACFSPRG